MTAHKSPRRLALAAGAAGIFLLGLLLIRSAGGQEQEGLEVLGHGPVHEAFAQPTTHKVELDLKVKKQPPDPVEELPPDEKPQGDNVVWISGYWAFDQESNDFIWISGFWRDVPPDHAWVPGYWVSVDGGFRWVSGYWSETRITETQYFPEPPEPIVEVPPPPPEAQSIYVPGIWIYRDSRYAWRPGHWMPYQQGWVWTSPRYSWTPGGYVFVNGYWDYEFNRRGVLFAPVVFGPRYFATYRTYQPRYVIATQPLLSALFVQPRFGLYYFGDYYGARYAQAGFTPWVNYRYAGRYTDPTFAYYNTRNRNDDRWAENLRSTYAARLSGEAKAPPRRIDLGQKVMNVNNVNVNLVTSLQQARTNKDVTLQRVSKDEATVARKQAEEMRSFVRTRQDVEGKLTTKGPRSEPTTAQIGSPAPVAGAPKARVSQAPPLPKSPEANPKINPNVAGKKDNPATPVGKQPDPKTGVKDPPPPTKKIDDIPPPKKDVPPPSKTPVDPPKTPKAIDPPQPKKDLTPKTQPKVDDPPLQPKKDVPPPKVEPKVQPKAPQPKLEQPPAPLPKKDVAPPQQTPDPPKQVTPPPQPKAPPTPPPQPKVQPVPPPQPKAQPAPQPKAQPAPTPPPAPKAAPAPPPAPKAAPAPTPKAPPAPKAAPVPPPQAAPQPPQQVGPRDLPKGPPPQAPKGPGGPPDGKKKG